MKIELLTAILFLIVAVAIAALVLIPKLRMPRRRTAYKLAAFGLIGCSALLLMAAKAHSEENPCLTQMREQSAKATVTPATELDYGKADGKIDSKQVDPFSGGLWSVQPFAAVDIVDSKTDIGGGIAGSYAFTRNLTLEAEATSYDADDLDFTDFVRDAGANLKVYLPIKQTGFAPYLIGGYRRDLVQHENLLTLGGGVEFRIKTWSAFVDARLVHGFEQDLNELGNRVGCRLGIVKYF